MYTPLQPRYSAAVPPAPAAAVTGRNKLSDSQYCSLLGYGLAAVLVMGSVYLMAHLPPMISFDKGLLAIAIIWAGAIPSFVYLFGDSLDALPFFPILGATFALIYGLTVFSNDRTLGPLNSRMVTTKALDWALGGFALLYAAFLITRYLFRGLVRPLALPDNGGGSLLRTMIWILMVVHLAFFFVPALYGTGTVESLSEPAGYVAFGMLFLLWRQKRLPFAEKILFFFACVPIELVWRFSTGLLSTVVLLGLFFQLMLWREKRRIPWLLIAGTVLFFVQLHPVKSEYRRYTFGHGRYAKLGALAKGRLFAELALKYYTGELATQEADSTGAAASRLADIRVLTYVMERTPEIVPYWQGETYKPILTKLIPRFFWPDKPREDFGQTFGHRYSLLDRDDLTTSINLPWLVEMYANFGIPGIFIGMPLMGFCLALLTEKFGGRGMNDLSYVVGATLLFQLSVNQENNLSLMLGPILLTALLLIAYFRMGHWLSTPRETIGRRPAGLGLAGYRNR